MINKIYSVLMRGKIPYGQYARKVTTDVKFDEQIANILVSNTTPLDYQAYCADLICSICYRSPLKKELMQLDPVNTYQFEIPPVTPVTEILNINPNTIIFNEPADRKQWLTKVYNCTSVIPALRLLTINNKSYSYTWDGNLSSLIELEPDFGFRFVTAEPTEDNTFSINIVRTPFYDIYACYSALLMANMNILPEYFDLVNDKDMNIALPALVFNYVKSYNGA